MSSVKNFENLIKRINETRNYLNDMIKEKSNLLDPEIIAVSQSLDSILNEYNKIAFGEIDK